jgi:hypothetical protein
MSDEKRDRTGKFGGIGEGRDAEEAHRRVCETLALTIARKVDDGRSYSAPLIKVSKAQHENADALLPDLYRVKGVVWLCLNDIRDVEIGEYLRADAFEEFKQIHPHRTERSQDDLKVVIMEDTREFSDALPLGWKREK